MPKYSMQALADHLDGQPIVFGQGDPKALMFSAIAELENLSPNVVAVVFSRPKEADFAAMTCGCLIVGKQHQQLLKTHAIVVDQPRLAFAKLLRLFHPAPIVAAGIHASAVVSDTAQVATTATIGPNVVVAEGANIGERCNIGAGSYIGANVVIGNDSIIRQNVTIDAHATLGQRCLIHPGVVIGADGFGFEPCQQTQNWLKIPHVGSVNIGNDVEIGANSTIDRGTLTATEIGHGVKLDNQCLLAHNVKIGQNSLLCGKSNVAGSSFLGEHVILGGKVNIVDHIEIADRVMIKACSSVLKSIGQPGVYSSALHVMPDKWWARCRSLITKLPKLVKQLSLLANNN